MKTKVHANRGPGHLLKKFILFFAETVNFAVMASKVAAILYMLGLQRFDFCCCPVLFCDLMP